eukprot:TRINITY_DN3184_c0_g1_i2.p1 TRINITY_DN3184_c0_g1~~TRINITY_DN3184_c0_g1_i2.p1  ORF type:complete len:211 (-),score=13.61 TRINITY_DN3184_c0_g1_i2:291-923(-)
MGSLEQLQRFSLAGRVGFEGAGNGPKVVLHHPSGASVEVYLHGAHVGLWRTASGRTPIFMSDSALFTPGTAIRGGIPLCWPQFSNIGGALPFHGFARTALFGVAQVCATPQGATRVLLRLTENEHTLALWPHKFILDYTVELFEEALTTEVQVTNKGTEPFSFTCALHSYYRVGNIADVTVAGFGGVSYLDNLQDRKLVDEPAAPRQAST